MYLVQQRAKILAHVQNTNSQYNHPPFGKKIVYGKNRQELQIVDRFTDASVRHSLTVDLELLDFLDERINALELYLSKSAKKDDGNTLHRLRSIPGVGKILALVFLYEIHDIHRFTQVGQFLSYARLVRPTHESAGKLKPGSGKKIGNAHLRWALGEAVCLLLRESAQAKKWLARREKKHGKGKALAILAAKLGRALYYLLKREEVFDEAKFWAS
jgi:transposase